MIINRIEIFNYGKWHHLTLPVRSQLEIYYGYNEVGKTTLLSFIRGVLFGYLPRRTSHKNYIPRQAKNYGGRLKITANGHQYLLERRSGKRGGQLKMFDLNGHQLPSKKFRRLMGPIDRTTFNALFYFGNVNLTKVAKMKKRDLVQEIQKIGITNSQFWLNLRQRLLKHSKHLYSPRGYRPILNQKLEQYQRLIKRVRNAKQQYTKYLTLIRASEANARKQKQFNYRLQCLRRSLRRLYGLQEHWLQIQHLYQLKRNIQTKIQPGFSLLDRQKLSQLRTNDHKYLNKITLLHHRLQDITDGQDASSQIQLYQSHRSLIKNLTQQFHQISSDLHQQTLRNHYLNDFRSRLKRLKPYCQKNGQNLTPLSSYEIQILKKNQGQINNLHKRMDHLKTKKLRLETQVSAPRHQDSIFKVRKLVPGIGLLILDLSLIRSKDLKRSKSYSGVEEFYHHPKQLEKRLNYQHERLINLNQSIIKLGERHHYSIDISPNQWLSIQNDLRQFDWLKQRINKNNKYLQTLNKALNHYFEQWQFISDQDIKANINGFKRVKTFVQRSEQMLKKNQQLQKQFTKLHNILSTIYQQQIANYRRLNHFYKQRKIKGSEEFDQQYQLQIQIKNDQREYHKLTRYLKLSKSLDEHVYKSPSLQNKIHDVERQEDVLDQRFRKVVNHQTALKTELKRMVRDGSYDRLKQKLANAQTQIIDLTRKWLLERLTSEWISQALNLANHDRMPKIERYAKANFYLLTNHHYRNILFNKTRILVLSKFNSRFDLHELSKGTLQQLYLALVLAFAEVLGKDFPMPILIDDGFTDFDIQRRRAAWHLLKKLSHRLQIIYCTSDNQVQRWYQVDSLN